ncbi:MAG: 16S rRNA (cytosine(967)-C(5))-methyltransferase RsmB [Gammaproteobacteria bacterium]|nr:16S rRNA (cytosine(967)-C(5))-methyltransferase RsmB [Gammaproteobacteria bacterium]
MGKTKIKPLSARQASIQALKQIIDKHQSLATVLPAVSKTTKLDDQPLLQEITYGCLRWYWQLESIIHSLVKKPFKERDRDIHFLLIIGLYQLIHMRTPAHAAVDETVKITGKIGKKWATSIVNAVLRNFQREQENIINELNSDPVATYSHPAWLINILKQFWPDEWENILRANNERPPMTLRVNLLKMDREQYIGKLAELDITCSISEFNNTALTLDKPVNVDQLPGFFEGHVSVQDQAAQFAASLLNCEKGHRILDACAAPGGKTGHIFETCHEAATLVAIDSEQNRMQLVSENMKRLGFEAKLIVADASQPDQWWDKKPFDRILLDAPCSATGVIRRHPDIKQLRQPEDIDRLVQTQEAILHALWPLLTPGGLLVYATCSILPQENENQIARFIDSCNDVEEQMIDVKWGRKVSAGRQILPGEHGMDGFYYACLRKV